ncbi:hypothetical protein [Actinomadura rayongensis]|uniref:Lipoprotein n=1 Tax=Actinomadura rayongensis TaxID=1429076 RepID=A0A6I4W4E0_9ACTN|nr:hypothetical protein [Actinomadura rayongensis]MXQ65549.1 hypothetical protein [Actinomadura rayongensis]
MDEMDRTTARPRRRRGRWAAVALAGLALTVTAACSDGNKPAAGGTDGVTPPKPAATGSGPVTIDNGTGGGGDGGSRGATGTYSAAFAKCMRAHGVPNFPDYKADANPFAPGSGINPASAAFKSAVEGPCKKDAPAWLQSSGKVSQGGGQ